MKKGKFVNPGCIMEIGSVHLILCHLESLFNMFFLPAGAGLEKSNEAR